ncbi:unnamed protein product [Dibothriocephalus latus]|uniref:Uncharacterized protein n=1 Tax=Dibothriocephalus latus TaxID=60516 RepID=A0A3P7N988_DIBLA|nr:unnamed protein product [Dibothriocephalus latus]
MPPQVEDLEHQLAEARSMIELRTKESLSLATRLCELESTLEKTERQLISSESRFVEQVKDSDRRIELARLETASLKTRLEGEVSKWRVNVTHFVLINNSSLHPCLLRPIQLTISCKFA